jgi:hypothetical protein
MAKDKITWKKVEASTKPFVNWEETREITGIVSNIREIKSEYGDQEVCDVGDHSVNIVAALRDLPKYEGKLVKIYFKGWAESKKGRKFKDFDIYLPEE